MTGYFRWWVRFLGLALTTDADLQAEAKEARYVASTLKNDPAISDPAISDLLTYAAALEAGTPQ